jgi:DNA polymerase-3 subunit alpha
MSKKSASLALFLDIETNGLPIKNGYKFPKYTCLYKYEPSRIIAISWAIYNFKGKQKLLKTRLVKPDGWIVTNTSIHGITVDQCMETGIPISNILDELRKDLNNVQVFVAHNVQFDYNILLSEIYRTGTDTDMINRLESLEKACTSSQTKDLVKIPLKSSYSVTKYKMPSLPELYKHCFNKEMDGHHDPEKDVTNMAECFFHCLFN